MDLVDADPSFLIAGVIPEGDEYDQMRLLADQLPLMHQTFTDFTAFAGFLSGRIIHRNGQSYISSGSRQAPLTSEQSALAQKHSPILDLTFPARQVSWACAELVRAILSRPNRK